MSNNPVFTEASNVTGYSGPSTGAIVAEAQRQIQGSIAWGAAPTVQSTLDISQLQIPQVYVESGDGGLTKVPNKMSPQYKWVKHNAESIVKEHRAKWFWLGLFLYILVPASVGFWVLTPGLWFSLPAEPVCPDVNNQTTPVISKNATYNQPRRVTLSNTAVAWALFLVFLFLYYFALASFGAHFPFHITDEL
jgi:hypothetical protein